MKFSCFLFLSEFCGVLCLCTPPGFYSFCHTLDLGLSHRKMFSDAEPESHIRSDCTVDPVPGVSVPASNA